MDADTAQAELAIFFKRHPDVDWSGGLAEDLLLGLVVEITRMGDDWDDGEADVQAVIERAFEQLTRPATNQTRH